MEEVRCAKGVDLRRLFTVQPIRGRYRLFIIAGCIGHWRSGESPWGFFFLSFENGREIWAPYSNQFTK